jgi:two-component system NtrC family response regulator
MAVQKPTLLIVEDDPGLQKQLKWAFDQYEVVLAEDRPSAIAALRRFEPSVVTMDLGLPPHPDAPTEGLALLQELLNLAPETKVIVLSGQQDRKNAMEAIASGAYDFCAKPFDVQLLGLIVERAFRLFDLRRENQRLQEQLSTDSFAGILTKDPQLMRLCRNVERVAPTNATVLLFGETGTGKELFARALHDLSPRKKARFIALNCAAIPETLLESELFGYERGAFTGASKQTPGKIELADGGTLFLDEIGDLPSALQAKLLRFLQERTIERLGGREEIEVDVRVICATHRDLSALITQGGFREDLFYRLSEITLTIPPLRDRVGDTVLLARAFGRRFAAAHNRPGVVLADDALAAIERHRWPGNVRELENCIKRAVIMADNDIIRADDLGLNGSGEDDGFFNLRQVREEAERRAVIRAMNRTDNNIAKAAELLGVSRPTLYDLMKRFGIDAKQ